MNEFIYFMYILQGGKTALHYCSRDGHVSVVEGLIRAGADVNAVDFVSLICNMHHNE